MAGVSERAIKLNANITARRQRSSERLLQNLADAMPRERSQPSLRQEQAKGGIPAARGEVRRDYQPGSQQTGGGIDSPLTETPGTREYHPERIIPSTDGAVFFQVRRASVLTMTDLLEREIKMVIEDAESESV